eukprot:10620465-Prorocentrum_lima.AAC.1
MHMPELLQAQQLLPTAARHQAFLKPSEPCAPKQGREPTLNMLHGNTCPCPPLAALNQDAGAGPRCPVCRKMR